MLCEEEEGCWCRSSGGWRVLPLRFLHPFPGWTKGEEEQKDGGQDVNPKLPIDVPFVSFYDMTGKTLEMMSTGENPIHLVVQKLRSPSPTTGGVGENLVNTLSPTCRGEDLGLEAQSRTRGEENH